MNTRSLIAAVLVAGTLVPVAASAQNTGEVRQDRRDVRQDRREVQQDRRDARQDVRRGDYQGARDDRREARDDRGENRQDWRDYRRGHRDVFRGPAYVGPRGYAYRPIGVGYRLAPAYYGRGYWVNDYARYRLGYPGHGRRWVRYGNDVVLVDISSGRVAVAYRGFFF